MLVLGWKHKKRVRQKSGVTEKFNPSPPPDFRTTREFSTFYPLLVPEEYPLGQNTHSPGILYDIILMLKYKIPFHDAKEILALFPHTIEYPTQNILNGRA